MAWLLTGSPILLVADAGLRVVSRRLVGLFVDGGVPSMPLIEGIRCVTRVGRDFAVVPVVHQVDSVYGSGCGSTLCRRGAFHLGQFASPGRGSGIDHRRAHFGLASGGFYRATFLFTLLMALARAADR